MATRLSLTIVNNYFIHVCGLVKTIMPADSLYPECWYREYRRYTCVGTKTIRPGTVLKQYKIECYTTGCMPS